LPELVLCETGETGLSTHESYSPFCLKVHRALKVAGLPYASRHGRPSDFRSINPAGQVPVLVADGTPISDSTRILAHIVALKPAALNVGLEAATLAEAWAWEEFSDSVLNGFLVAARWADDRNWPLVRRAYFGRAPWFVRTLIAPSVRRRVVRGLVARDVWRTGAVACWERFQVALDQLEQRAPSRGCWLGELSTADISLFAQLHSLRTPLTAWQAGQLATRKTLALYLDRVDQATAERRAAPEPHVGPFFVAYGARGSQRPAVA